MSAQKQQPRPKTELSIIITAHSEGILLHRTLKSVLRASKQLDAQKTVWELLIHVDNGTSEMLEYIEANREFLAPFKIFYNSFRDLSASRNFMIKQASGGYVAFVDADDLVSENWFIQAISYLRNHDHPAVLHTEWLINFGKQNLAWRKYDSRSKEEDALIMVWANRWDSAVIAPKEIFEKFPYAANTHGFGSEDWHFGSQTLAADIPHHTIPETVLFARRKDVSEMSIQQTDFRTVHYTDLLDVDFIKNIDISTIPTLKDSGRTERSKVAGVATKISRLPLRIVQKGYRLAVRQPGIGPHAQAAKTRILGKRQSTSSGHFPAWLLAEWRAIHSIEKGIFPDKELLATMPLYVSEMYELGIAYRNLLQYIFKLPDYIIAVPHLVAGGADLVILNYVRALQEIHPDWHILVIATDNTPSPWAERLPPNVDFMPWGKVCEESGIWQDLHLQLFARMIVQLKCKRLHIIQSALGFTFAAKYKSLLSSNDYHIYSCAFCEDVDDEGRYIGHVHSGLPGAYPVFEHVFTDNQAIINQLAYEYGYDKNRFTVHYQPAEITATSAPKSTTSRPYRILWASRITSQKRPDILKKIAESLDPALYKIDAYGSLHNDFTPEYFTDVPSLEYRGTFNGLSSIELSTYDAFLYTSANDGVPNILLGIAAAGLPIVASNAGGVGEFIQNGLTGSLIAPIEDIGSYLKALDAYRTNPAQARKLAENAQQLLLTRHTVAAFEKEVKKAGL